MNLDKVSNVWEKFSKLNNIDLKHKERSIGNVVQANYLINYTNKIATFSFIGILSKTAEGNTTDKTSIIVEYENRLNIDNFELEITAQTKKLLTEEKPNELEKIILESLEMFNGSSITLKDNFIRIDANQIFSTMEEFNHVVDLISNLKRIGHTT